MIASFLVDGVDHYSIDIRRVGGVLKLYPMSYPPNRRGGGVHDHHLYSSGEICVSAGKEPRTIDQAKAIAMFWATGWSRYQRTGVFPNGATKVNVKN